MELHVSQTSDIEGISSQFVYMLHLLCVKFKHMIPLLFEIIDVAFTIPAASKLYLPHVGLL